ncbi:hypothetical protein HMPREF9069_01551 [Atopobium sp. oral taxon 810 str. F0209]|nr:hypothetical protein HMPREF9069_01551 [Atopobium sp. oral taxon 810 str. F0209]
MLCCEFCIVSPSCIAYGKHFSADGTPSAKDHTLSKEKHTVHRIF